MDLRRFVPLPKGQEVFFVVEHQIGDAVFQLDVMPERVLQQWKCETSS
jgi:hypothetical protein